MSEQIKNIAIASSNVDLAPFVSYVGNQSTINSCSAWAVASAKSVQDAIANNKKFSEKNNANDFYSPSFIYTLAKQKAKNDDCFIGVDLGYAFNILETCGIPRLSQCPYFNTPWKCSSIPISQTLYDSAKLHTDIALHVRLNILDFIYLLSHKCPIIIQTVVDRAFQRQGENYDHRWNDQTPFIWYGWAGDPRTRLEHCMLCVGYSDYYGAFKVLNSQGKDFGDGGFFWIDYNTMFQIVQDAYILNGITYDEMSNADKIAITQLNNTHFEATEQRKLALGLNAKNKTAFNLNFGCIDVQKLSDQIIVNISVTSNEGTIIRKNIPISSKMCCVFSLNNYNYYIQLQSIDEAKVISGFLLKPTNVNVIVTRLVRH